MRISIWEQFSSNHSASFTVVGEFGSAEDAERAASQMQAFFDSINAWFEQPGNEGLVEKRRFGVWSGISQPELETSQRYGIQWYERTIDWLWPEMTHAAVAVENLVIIHPNQTWQGGGPLADLLAKLGGKAMIDGDVSLNPNMYPEESRSLDISVSCNGPDKSSAARIVDAVREQERLYQQSLDSLSTGTDSKTRPAPWLGAEPDSMLEIYASDIRVRASSWGTVIRFDDIQFFSPQIALRYFVDWLIREGCTDLKISVAEYRDNE